VTGPKQFVWCEALYAEKAAELILYGRALGLSHGEAEDVLQETFLALLKMVAPPLGKLPLEPEHYCVRSYRNRALNHRRSLWRRLTRELESLRWFEKSPGESSAERAAMDCLAALPVEQREAIVLKIWHRFTFEEIGGLLGISPNTAAGRYRYGLQKIKLQLEGAVYERERDEIIHPPQYRYGGRAGEPAAFLASAPGVGDA
jgi:RNA polymerase sigma-70 factor (ECF subfamily)